MAVGWAEFSLASAKLSCFALSISEREGERGRQGEGRGGERKTLLTGTLKTCIACTHTHVAQTADTHHSSRESLILANCPIALFVRS